MEKLNNIINKTKLLHDKFTNIENIIKNSFTEFYHDFRSYEIDLKNNIEEIMKNIDDNIEIEYLNVKNNKEDILIKYKNDKCFIIISKLFDKLENINVIEEEKNWKLLKDNIMIGTIKKLKDKLNIEFNDSIKITLNKNNIDNNLLIIKNILN